MVKFNHRENLESMASDEEGSGGSPKTPKDESKQKPMKGDKNDLDPEYGLTTRQIEEILFLPATDHSGMQLISAQLTGTHFLN